jgi:HSP20 family protein
MTSLTRWDPFSDLRGTMDTLFEQGFSRPWRLLHATDEGIFPIELSETDDTLEIKAALPGIRSEDVDISVADDVLTIKAEHKTQTEEKRRDYHRQEISYGSLHRSIRLPLSVDADKAQAQFEDGMLHLQLPSRDGAGEADQSGRGGQRRKLAIGRWFKV